MKKRFNSGYVDHSQDYYVISSSLHPITPTVLIFLDRSISTSVNLNNFTIIRNLLAANQIIIKAKKPSLVNTGRGFIFPEYISPNMKKNLPNITKTLNEKNLL